MKKTILLFLALLLLLLPSCVATRPNDVVSSESTSDQSIVCDEPYSFSEVNPVFGPGPFSVNELADIFGEPTFVGGYYNEKKGCFGLNVLFNDVMYDFEANNGEELNFIVNDNPNPSISYDKYKVTSSDLDVQMKPRIVGVFGGNWELPRGIHFGCSREELYNAYNGNKGKERTAQGQFEVSYNYGETGRITYSFYDEEGKIDELADFAIEWYDAFNWDDLTSYLDRPPA